MSAALLHTHCITSCLYIYSDLLLLKPLLRIMRNWGIMFTANPCCLCLFYTLTQSASNRGKNTVYTL